METIYFTGYHGVGKTMIGKILSGRKNLKYIDIDSFIEEKESKNLDEIVNAHGIDYLMNLGKYTLKNSISQGMVVSLNADQVADEENRHTIKKSGRVIYLRAKTLTIYNNLQEDYKNIPTLKNAFTIFNIEKEVEKLKPYYEELENYIVDIDDKNINEVATEVIAIYNFINKKKCHIFIK